MELVFFYINQTSSNFIQKKGFNFSANYNFYVDYIDEKYVLRQKKCTHKLPKDFFDEQGVITNITAVVGENGTGKTTLLNNISNYGGSVKNQDHDYEYDNYFMEKYEKDKTVAIYLEKCELVCYHNIDNFRNETGIKECYLQQGSVGLQDIVRNNKAFESISKICISNSMYALEDGVSIHRNINKISLNVNSLEILKNIFYKKKIKTKSIEKTVGGWSEILDIVEHANQVSDFQQILDILYLQYIDENKIESVFVKNIFVRFKIRFKNLKKMIDDRYENFIIEEEEKEETSLKKQTEKIIPLIKINPDLYKTDIFVVIYTNLVMELLIYKRREIEDVKINNREELVDYVSSMIRELIDQKDRCAADFQEAFEEIQEYAEILDSCKRYSSSLPISNLAYVSYPEIEYRSETCGKFVKLIKKSIFKEKPSYVLRYIDIGGLQLASGERALLNMFSWMYFIPKFKHISDNVEESFHENILLLIDEIDLYCHPLWQQKLLNYLIEEIKAEYSNKKVQIIFTTHSPIVLSDMPRSNVIFLKRENGKCSVDEASNHEETFGANIYKLFDDAFFLGEKGQVGEFARKKIQGIIDKIKPDTRNVEEVSYPILTEEEVCLLEQQIALIGEKIIRDKLYEMLYKCKYNDLDLRNKKIAIYKEKIKRLQNEEVYDTN